MSLSMGLEVEWAPGFFPNKTCCLLNSFAITFSLHVFFSSPLSIFPFSFSFYHKIYRLLISRLVDFGPLHLMKKTAYDFTDPKILFNIVGTTVAV